MDKKKKKECLRFRKVTLEGKRGKRISGINFSVNRGEILAVLDKNGISKAYLLKAIKNTFYKEKFVLPEGKISLCRALS